MHKVFYASGFLYHPPTQQILLQQQSTGEAPSLWTLLGGMSSSGETVEITFQRIVRTLLNLELTPRNIYPIYTYFHEALDKDHWISYAEVGSLRQQSLKKNTVFAWFNRKQILKLPINEQTKQDITVGFRVIDAKTRKSLGQHTLE